jgi:hypothetical protein
MIHLVEEYLDVQQKQRARHEKKKSATPFEKKPFLCKPLTMETFRVMAGPTIFCVRDVSSR